MIFSTSTHDDETAGDEELNDIDDLDASLDDSVLDELVGEETEEEDDTMGFGRLEEDDTKEEVDSCFKKGNPR